MLTAQALHRRQLVGNAVPVISWACVALATLVIADPEYTPLSPFFADHAIPDLVGAVASDTRIAVAFGLVALVLGCGVEVRLGDVGGFSPFRSWATRLTPRITRGQSDNHGHADWLSMPEALRHFSGPHPAYGGASSGKPTASTRIPGAHGRAFHPAEPGTWGQGGTAPLLVDPCRTGPTHALVFAGSGGFKTTSVAVPTLLTWTGSAVVLDPSREVGPMVARYRRQHLGHRVALLDPAGPHGRGRQRAGLDRPRLAPGREQCRGDGRVDRRRSAREPH